MHTTAFIKARRLHSYPHMAIHYASSAVVWALCMQDVLRARVRTTGIVQQNFQIKDKKCARAS